MFNIWTINIFTVQCLNDINVQQLNITMNHNQDYLNLLIKIQHRSKYTQRELADELGFSLGKLNYCLKALKNKGLIKINNFKKSNKKISFIYILTPRGLTKKIQLTLNVMKNNMREYDQLSKELNSHVER